ncbi:MAG: hypothetical protein ABL867_08400 [Rickettsiales bacterium]
MKNKFIAVATVCTLFSTSSFAEKAISMLAAPKCGFQEQVSISINFNLTAEGFTQAKGKFDEKMVVIADYAKNQKLQKFELQSMNYNINSNYNGSMQNYQLSGSVNYQMANADDAIKFAEFLTQQKLNVSVNGNSYKNGSMCNDARSNNIE